MSLGRTAAVGRQKHSVKGGVTGLGGGQLLGEEGKGSPGTSNKLLKTAPREILVEESGCTRLGTEAKADLAE